MGCVRVCASYNNPHSICVRSTRETQSWRVSAVLGFPWTLSLGRGALKRERERERERASGPWGKGASIRRGDGARHRAHEKKLDPISRIDQLYELQNFSVRVSSVSVCVWASGTPMESMLELSHASVCVRAGLRVLCIKVHES